MKYLIIGHAEYPNGVYNTLKFFKDDLNQVAVLSADAADFDASLEAMVKLHGEDLIVISDMLGGSANLAAANLLKHYQFHLITGVNIPFLLELILSNAKSSEEIADIVEMAKEQLVYVNALLGPKDA